MVTIRVKYQPTGKQESLLEKWLLIQGQKFTWDLDKEWRPSGGQVVKNPPANAGDMSLIPGLRVPHMLLGD